MRRLLITFSLRVDDPADGPSAPPEVKAFTDKAYEAVRTELMHLHPSFQLDDIQEVGDEE